MKKFVSLCAALALCLSLSVSAFAAETTPSVDAAPTTTATTPAAATAQITVGEKTYERVLQALMDQEGESATLQLDTDITLTSTVVLGSSDYDGTFTEAQTVPVKNVTINLNGHALKAEGDFPLFELQEGYVLTISDSSEQKTGAFEGSVLLGDGAQLAADREITVIYPEDAAAEEETPAEEAAPVNPFTDVAETSAFYKGILWAVEKDITNGKTETTFVPGETCTRAQIITFLWRAAGSPEPAAATPFTDVEADKYYTKATAWAAEQKIAEGETFAPNDPCTRAAAVTFMWKAAGSAEAEAAAFSDVAADAEYAAAVSWAVAQGVTNGTTETTFSPDSTCTRGQIVTFLYRADQAAQTATAPAEGETATAEGEAATTPAEGEATAPAANA